MYFNFFKGKRNSEIRPRLPDDLPPRKKALYIDEAITKTSECLQKLCKILLQ